MNARGFTLLEVLVALAILGVAVVASIQGFAQGLRLLKLSGDHQAAMLVADEKTREVVTPAESREEGIEGAFRWERTTVRVITPELTNSPRASRWHVYQIDVRVRWDEHREVALTTLRTVVDPTTVTAPGTAPAPTTPGTPATPGTPGTPGTPPSPGAAPASPTMPGTRPGLPGPGRR